LGGLYHHRASVCVLDRWVLSFTLIIVIGAMSIVDTLVFPDDYTLWDYQRDVVTKTINWALDPDSRRVATASGPTGCGKTFIQMATALEISRRLRADSLLVTRLFEEEDRSSIASLATSQPSAVDPMSLRRTRVLITTTRYVVYIYN